MDNQAWVTRFVSTKTGECRTAVVPRYGWMTAFVANNVNLSKIRTKLNVIQPTSSNNMIETCDMSTSCSYRTVDRIHVKTVTTIGRNKTKYTSQSLRLMSGMGIFLRNSRIRQPSSTKVWYTISHNSKVDFLLWTYVQWGWKSPLRCHPNISLSRP